MTRRFLAPALIATLLAACSQPANEAPAPAAPAAPEAPETPAAPAESGTAAPASSSTVAQAEAPAPAAAPAPAPLDPNAPEPRLGKDYEVLPVPQPTWNPSDGRMEVAEVFSYMCVHCAEFQPAVDLYKPTLPADARWVYVPGAFGGAWNEAARAYFTAETMGIAERTHSQVFPAIFVQQKIKQGTPEEFADLYAGFGANRGTFLSTMSSFGITAKLNRAKQFALRTGVTATPTIIVDGKYRVNITQDRGAQGMLQTVDYLLARERAARAGAAPAATPAP